MQELLLPSSDLADDAQELQSSPRLLHSHCRSAQQRATRHTACAAPHIPVVALQKEHWETRAQAETSLPVVFWAPAAHGWAEHRLRGLV